MKVVWKHGLPKSEGIHTVEMAQGAEFLTFGTQRTPNPPDKDLCMWVLVDIIQIKRPRVWRRFAVVWTGNDFDATSFVYRGTTQTTEGMMREVIVWHLFEEVEGD